MEMMSHFSIEILLNTEQSTFKDLEPLLGITCLCLTSINQILKLFRMSQMQPLRH